MASWCKYWDSGWCYHPEMPYTVTDCVGISNCDIREPEIIATDREEEDA